MCRGSCGSEHYCVIIFFWWGVFLIMILSITCILSSSLNINSWTMSFFWYAFIIYSRTNCFTCRNACYHRNFVIAYVTFIYLVCIYWPMVCFLKVLRFIILSRMIFWKWAFSWASPYPWLSALKVQQLVLLSLQFALAVRSHPQVCANDNSHSRENKMLVVSPLSTLCSHCLGIYFNYPCFTMFQIHHKKNLFLSTSSLMRLHLWCQMDHLLVHLLLYKVRDFI